MYFSNLAIPQTEVPTVLAVPDRYTRTPSSLLSRLSKAAQESDREDGEDDEEDVNQCIDTSPGEY